jgi:hypothetical protein
MQVASANEDESTGVSIAVTQMVKAKASYLVKNLAIDCNPGVQLHTTLDEIEAHLDPVVSKILWMAAIKDLNLRIENQSGNSAFPLHMCGFSDFPRKSRTDDDISELKRHKAFLEKEVDRLENNTHPFPAAEALDPALLTIDPVLNLTCRSVRILNTEIERIDGALHIGARWRYLLATRPLVLPLAADNARNT